MVSSHVSVFSQIFPAMLNRFLFAFGVLCIFFVPFQIVRAQHELRFFNESLQQEVTLQPGDVVKFEYAGYLGQPEALENRVIQISNNAIVLGQTSFGYLVPKTRRTILLEDITGFRKFIRARYTLKSLAQIGSAVASIVLFRQVINRDKLSGTQDILLTLGVGASTTILVESLFPKKVKRKMVEGWRYEVR